MMTLLTGWPSILARIGMVLLIAGSLVLFGWFKGHSSEAHVFAAYRQQLAIQAATQVQHNADIVKQQRATTARIEGNYETQLAALHARTDAQWLRYLPSPSIVSSVTGAPACADATPKAALFVRRAADDAAQVVGLQEFIKGERSGP